MSKKLLKQDHLQRFLFETAPVRGEYIYLHDTFQTIIHQHDYPLPIRKLLGEALCGAALLSAILKFEGRLTVQFQGKGPLKMLLAQCDNEFNMRGLVKWEGEMNYHELMQAFSQGVLVIMLDMGLKNRYQGVVSWRGDSLSQSLEGYFSDSEQIPTKIWLQVDDLSAAGFLLQVMPQTEQNAGLVTDWERITRASFQLDQTSLLSQELPDLLKHHYPEDDIHLLEPDLVQFRCTCTRKRGEDAISLLGKEEAEAEIKNNKHLVVTCEFCNQPYIFEKADVEAIFNKQDGKSSDRLH